MGEPTDYSPGWLMSVVAAPAGGGGRGRPRGTCWQPGGWAPPRPARPGRTSVISLGGRIAAGGVGSAVGRVHLHMHDGGAGGGGTARAGHTLQGGHSPQGPHDGVSAQSSCVQRAWQVRTDGDKERLRGGGGHAPRHRGWVLARQRQRWSPPPPALRKPTRRSRTSASRMSAIRGSHSVRLRSAPFCIHVGSKSRAQTSRIDSMMR